MPRIVVAVAFVVAVVAGTVGRAQAITHGDPDHAEHPYVGLVVFFDGNGEYMSRCTGTLLSPTVVLTAGHCASGAAKAMAFFDENLGLLTPPYTNCAPYECSEGTPHSHPAFDGFATFPNTSDVGVVLLNRRVAMDQYAELPDLDLLDALATRRGQRDVSLQVVGYGLQGVKPSVSAELARYKATTILVTLHSAWTDGYNIRTSNSPGAGRGGSCSGDSGGPLFYPANSNTIVGIVSFGINANCKGGDWSYRTDISNTQDFVRQFLP